MIVLTHSYPQQWIQYGAPKSFWISGFFYPQGNQYLALYETYISTDACYSPFQKANGRYFSVLLLIMLYMVAAILQKMVLTFKSVDVTSVTIQMKSSVQYVPVVPFIMLYMVVLTFEYVDKILKCDHSNESYWAVYSCGTVYYAVQGCFNFQYMVPWYFHRNKLLSRSRTVTCRII